METRYVKFCSRISILEVWKEDSHRRSFKTLHNLGLYIHGGNQNLTVRFMFFKFLGFAYIFQIGLERVVVQQV